MTTYNFECYRIDDVPRFIDLLIREDATLIGVLKGRQATMQGGMFVIVYEHTEELQMEVLT